MGIIEGIIAPATRVASFVTPASLAVALIVLAGSTSVCGQVVINEFLASNRSTNLDDESDSPDWVEIVNTSDAEVELQGYTISDEPTVGDKWTFPRSSLDPGERLVLWCSGKDRTAPASESIVAADSTIPFEAEFIALGDDWKFLTGPVEEVPPPKGWNTIDFDDAGWSNGPTPIGFGEDIVVTETPEDFVAIFARHEFEVPDPDAVVNLVLSIAFDDGYVAYLNGDEVARVNLRDDAEINFATTARSSSEARRSRRVNLTDAKDKLVAGTNVLAFGVFNLRASSSDLVLAPELGTVPPVLHTNFTLARSGESVFLSNPEGDVVDAITYPEQASDRSYGRFPDLTGPFFYMLVPTPGERNHPAISEELIPETVQFSPNGGKHGPEELEVMLEANIPIEGFEIRYTGDGSAPTPSSTLFSSAEPIQFRRDTVIRAAGFIGEQRVTRTSSRHFWGWASNTRNLALPVMAIGMDPRDYSFVHNSDGARGRTAERSGFMEIYNFRGELETDVGMGLRLHGGAGRGGDFNTKKAYKAYFRGVYGNKRLNYRLISQTDVESFDKLVLRSNFNDAFRTGGAAGYIRDQVIRDLHGDMGQLFSHGDWYNLIVNARYRGVYNVVERMDRKFLASYFPDDGENWDVIKTGNDVLDGNGAAWSQMSTFFGRNQLLRDETLEEAGRLIDIENFTSYMILNIWAQNHDWPHNNWYAARPQRPDGRWIFLSWDAEFGLGRSPGGFSNDTFAHVMGNGATHASVLRSLLSHPVYQSFFLQKLDEYLAGPLSPDNVLRSVRLHASTIDPDMAEEAALTGQSITTWRNNIRSIETFAARRGSAIRNHIYNSTRFTFPRVTSVSPRRLTMEGPTEVLLRGLRLVEGTEFFINEVSVPIIENISVSRVSVMLPFDVRLAGDPVIRTSHPVRGGSESTGLFRVSFLAPEPETIVPPNGSPGDTVTIIGSDFLEEARVEFGGVPSPSVTVTAREVLSVVVPAGVHGQVDVRVFNTVPGDVPSDDTIPFTVDGDAVPVFQRGDVDDSGRVNISDALAILRSISGAAPRGPCEDAMDTDDSGEINITDGILLLGFLFRSGETPAEPFARCDVDESDDALTCSIVAARCP